MPPAPQPPPKKADASTRLRPNVAPKQDPPSTRVKPSDQTSKVRPNPQPVKRDESTRARAGQVPASKGDSSTRLRRAPRVESSEERPSPPPKKKSKAILWIFAAAVLLIGGGIGVAVYVKSKKPGPEPVVKPPVEPAAPTPPPKPPRHNDPDVNEALMASDALVEKGDFAQAFTVLDAAIAKIEAREEGRDRQKLLVVLRDEKDNVRIKRDDVSEVEGERARAVCEEVDDLLAAWKLGDAEQRLTEHQRALTLNNDYEPRRSKLDAMKQAAPVLDPLMARATGSGLSDGDVATAETHALSDISEISRKARIVLVRNGARPLLDQGRQAIEARLTASKKRYADLDAGKKAEGDDPNAGEGDFFYRPRTGTSLDAVMEKIADGKLQEQFAKARDTLRTFDHMRSEGTGLRDLNDLTDFLEPFPAFHYYYALGAFFAGDYGTSTASIAKAVQLEPKYGEAWALAGRIAIERNKFDDADTALEKAEALMPDLPEIYLYRAFLNVYRQKGQAAKDMLAKAQKMAPGHLALIGTSMEMTNAINGPSVDLPHVAQSANYIVKTDLSKERAELILNELEAMRPHYGKVCGQEAKQLEPVLVYYFKNRKEFDDYGRSGPGVLGYYSPAYRQFVFYEVPNDLEGTLHVLRHEGFHQYVHMVIPNIPRWVNEALAEFTGGTKLENHVIKEEGYVTPFLKKYRLDQMTDQLDGSYFKDLLRNAYDYGPMNGYADGWTLFHFLFRYKGGFYKERARIYIDALRAGKQPREAFAAALPPKEYGGIYGEWKEHFNKLKKKASSTDDD